MTKQESSLKLAPLCVLTSQYLCALIHVQSGNPTSTNPVLQLTSMQLTSMQLSEGLWWGEGAGKEAGAFSEPSQRKSLVEDKVMLLHTHFSPSCSYICSDSEPISPLPHWACPGPSSSFQCGHSRDGCSAQTSRQVPHPAEPEPPEQWFSQGLSYLTLLKMLPWNLAVTRTEMHPLS